MMNHIGTMKKHKRKKNRRGFFFFFDLLSKSCLFSLTCFCSSPPDWLVNLCKVLAGL
jgi:hypothetical protein